MRYSAFISYSHADQAWASWLHRAIETYRLPRRIVGHPGPFGPIGARLPPVFRDRDDLAAAPSLSQALTDALSESETLIVICSPHSAASRWVNEEIRQFIALGRADRIFCLIVDGDDGDPPTYLPPALAEAEPLAADVRPDKDGRGHAKLKLISGILGLKYDELRQREATRRQQQLTLIAAASLTGLLLTSGLAIFALVSRAEALRERDIAEQRTKTAERTVDFVKSMFKVSDPSEARGSTISAREILDRGAQQIQGGLNNEPAVKAELGVTLGEVYESVGLYKEGDQLIRKTLLIAHGQDAITVDQLMALGDSADKMGNYEDAIAYDRKAVNLALRSRDVGPAVRSRLFQQLSQAQSDAGQLAAAELSAEQALKIDRGRAVQDISDIARDLEALGVNEMAQGQWTLAEPRIQQALALRLKAEGPDSPSVADDLNSLGNIAYRRGDLSASEADYRRVMAIDEKVFDPDHPDVAVALNNLARVMVDRREFAQAAPLLERALAINRKQRSDTADDMAFVYSNLALAKRGLGKSAEATALFAKALVIARASHHRTLAPILSELAAARCRQGDVTGGRAQLEEARPIMRADYPSDPWRSAWIDSVMGECLLRGGEADRGAGLIRSSAPIILARWTPETLYGHEAARRLQLTSVPSGNRR